VKYPIYDGYPKQIVDLQLKERSKVLAMERELIRRESSLQQLQTKVREADDEHTAWMQAHARGSEADAKYRKEIMVCTYFTCLQPRLHVVCSDRKKRSSIYSNYSISKKR
jgi:hypothetical protein